MEVSGQHHAPGRFNLVQESRYTLNMRLGGPQTWSGQLWRRETYPAPTEIRTPDHPERSKS
jgi:hypothetical protein